MRDQLIEWYLDYVNNFISVEKFAEYYGISADQAWIVIQLGRTINETPHPES